jgi:hypothetical protein
MHVLKIFRKYTRKDTLRIHNITAKPSLQYGNETEVLREE